jgi:hypothetical protein
MRRMLRPPTSSEQVRTMYRARIDFLETWSIAASAIYGADVHGSHGKMAIMWKVAQGGFPAHKVKITEMIDRTTRRHDVAMYENGFTLFSISSPT